MEIKITNNRKISEIQKDFSTLFPFLKLEFFSNHNSKKEKAEKEQPVDCSKRIQDCRKVNRKGHVTISPGQTVAELEKAFFEFYGLPVQIFRKSGKMWLQSTITDDWTLKEQNEHGEALSKLISG